MRKWTCMAGVVLTVLMILSGCKRIPLYERSTTVRLNLKLELNLDLELDLSVDTELDQEYAAKLNGKMPEYVEALFYDPETHGMSFPQGRKSCLWPGLS